MKKFNPAKRSFGILIIERHVVYPAIRRKTISVLQLTCVLVFLLACSAQIAADAPSPNSRRIVDIIMSRNSESLILTISGNRSLNYKASMQASPLGLLIQFPDTGFELSRDRFHPPDNQFIHVIRTGETDENNTTTSNVLIGLKKETLYDLVPFASGLRVVFPKSPALSGSAQLNENTANTKPPPEPVQKNTPVAAVLKTVTLKSLADYLIVDVEADGAIKNYKTFILKNPARIVFDIYQVKSPYRSEQITAVESKWVRRIRYFGHPDRLRLVIETHDEYLSNYASFPTPTGLFIQVGEGSADASRPPNAPE
jgi:hypothetical protein